MTFFAGTGTWEWEGRCLGQSGKYFRGRDDECPTWAPSIEPEGRLQALPNLKRMPGLGLGGVQWDLFSHRNFLHVCLPDA